MAYKKPKTPRTESLGHFTELEAETLNILWDRDDPISTQDIHEAVLQARVASGSDQVSLAAVFYTLERLVTMGILSDEKRGKARYFAAALPREAVIARMLSQTHAQLGGGPLGKVLQGLTGLSRGKSKPAAGDSEYLERLLAEIRNLESDGE